MPLNVVVNNSLHVVASADDRSRAQFDQPHGGGSPGSDAAVAAQERAQLEAGTLTAAGTGIGVDRSA